MGTWCMWKSWILCSWRPTRVFPFHVFATKNGVPKVIKPLVSWNLSNVHEAADFGWVVLPRRLKSALLQAIPIRMWRSQALHRSFLWSFLFYLLQSWKTTASITNLLSKCMVLLYSLFYNDIISGYAYHKCNNVHTIIVESLKWKAWIAL